MAEIPEDYNVIEEDGLKPMLKYIFLSLIAIAISVLVTRSIKLATMLLIWDVLALMHIHCYRTRYCPTCKSKMNRIKDNMFAVVEYHSCDKCKIAISTNVKNGSWG